MKFSYLGKQVEIKGVSKLDWIYSKIKETKQFYEMDLLRYFRYSLKGLPVGCVLDIGANIGNHSVFFGMYVADRVVCFEPNPDVFPILINNLSVNNVKCKYYKLGLGDKAAMAKIELPDEHKNNVGAARLIESQGIEDIIHIVTLDSLLLEIEEFANGLNIVAVKIDIEGMEPAALRGGLCTLTKYKPDLFIEISNAHQMEMVKSIIEPIGYKPIVSWAATPVWHFSHSEKLRHIRMFRIKAYIFWHKNIISLLKKIKSSGDMKK